METVFLVILLMTTFLSAFCAFQANSWGSITSGKYQEATKLRTESARAYNDGNTRLLVDVSVFITWADLASRNETVRAQVVASRFTPRPCNLAQYLTLFRRQLPQRRFAHPAHVHSVLVSVSSALHAATALNSGMCQEL